MKRSMPFLPDIWREMCGRGEMTESVGQAAQILSQHLPVRLLLVRSLDPSRPCVETVAAGALGSMTVPNQMRTDCSVQEMEHILDWCHQDQVLHQRAREAGHSLPGLLPHGLRGDIVAGSLRTAQGPTGVLIAAARPPQSFQRQHEELFRPLLEPFAVALEHH